MAGVRTAAVLVVGTATLSTPVGQPSLGNYIFTGLQTENWVDVLFGCVAAAGLALIVDALLALVASGARRGDARRAMIGVAGLLLGTAAAAAPLLAGAGAPPAYVVGAKNFSEQFILAELMGERLQAVGATVERRDGLGSAVAFRRLAGRTSWMSTSTTPARSGPRCWAHRHAAARELNAALARELKARPRRDGARAFGLRERLCPGHEAGGRERAGRPHARRTWRASRPG
jgi:hypothetical protein